MWRGLKQMSDQQIRAGGDLALQLLVFANAFGRRSVEIWRPN